MTMAIYDVVVTIINEVTGIEPEYIALDSHIVDDLQIDSFAAIQILERFEEEFNITINTNDFIGVYIISDIVNTLENLGATVDENNSDENNDNIETIADTSDPAYLSTEDDIFSNGSKKVLTYKNMLDLMYDENKFFKAQSIINTSIAPYSTEKLVSSGSAQTSYSIDTNFNEFTIYTGATNYKTFNEGLTHFISTATMTITMAICLQFAAPINATSTDEDEANYNIARASLDFDNDGTQTSGVEDTGAAYVDDNTMANTPAVMNAGNNSRATGELQSCENTISCNLNEISTVCFKDDRVNNCATTPTTSVVSGVCETTSGCETSGCGGEEGESSGCSAERYCYPETIGCYSVETRNCGDEVTDYKISYKATVYPTKSDTAIATITATATVSDIFLPYTFPATYVKIPVRKYFEKYSVRAGLAFGFEIDITASTDYPGDIPDFTIANSTITYNRPTYYVFNPNDKAVQYKIANNLYTNYTQT